MPRKRSDLTPQPGQPGYVGRGHPPEHGKIKPGEVRNPFGRRGKPSSNNQGADYASGMARLLAQPVQSKDGQAFDAAQLALNSLYKVVNSGNVRAIELYFALRERYANIPADEQEQDLSDEDQSILDRFRGTLLQEKQGSDEAGHLSDDDTADMDMPPSSDEEE